MDVLAILKSMDAAQPTLKAISTALGVPPQRMYSVAKQPKVGEVYDAKVYNWDAIGRFIEKRVPEGSDPADLITQALALDVEFASSDRRKGPRGEAGDRNIQIGDRLVPYRRFEPAIGDKIIIKKKSTVYDVVMLTPISLVLQIEGTDELTCLSNWTFNQKVIAQSQQAVALAGVRDGTYPKPTAEAAEAPVAPKAKK